MKKYEEFFKRIDSFDDAVLDPDIADQLEKDPDLRAAFEAQRHAVNLIRLKRYETQSPESAKRIRAGVLRTIRSEAVQPAVKTAPVWWGGFKLAATCAVLVLIALPFVLKPGGDIQPVTSFTSSGTDTELAGDVPAFQMPDDQFLVASNTAPSLQFAPIDVAPVNFDVP